MMQQEKAKRNTQKNSKKFFDVNQIEIIRKEAERRCILAETRNQLTAIREWAVIDVLTSTGIKVEEIINLRCRDIKFGLSSEIVIRNSQGNISRSISAPGQIQSTLFSMEARAPNPTLSESRSTMVL